LALGLSVIVALVRLSGDRPVLDVALSEGHHETGKWSALQVIRLLA
jgi:hypothetical protein